MLLGQRLMLVGKIRIKIGNLYTFYLFQNLIVLCACDFVASISVFPISNLLKLRMLKVFPLVFCIWSISFWLSLQGKIIRCQLGSMDLMLVTLKKRKGSLSSSECSTLLYVSLVLLLVSCIHVLKALWSIHNCYYWLESVVIVSVQVDVSSCVQSLILFLCFVFFNEKTIYSELSSKRSSAMASS